MTKTRPSGNRVIELTFRGAVCDPVVANVAVFGSKISADASGVASSPPNAMPPATNTRPSARRMAWKFQPCSCIGPAAANLPVFGSKISAVAGAGPLAPVASGAAESPPRRRTRPSRRRTVVGPPRFPTISPVAFQVPVFGFQISAERVAGSAPSKRTRPSASPIRASPYGSEPTSVEPSEAIAPGAGVSPTAGAADGAADGAANSSVVGMGADSKSRPPTPAATTTTSSRASAINTRATDR